MSFRENISNNIKTRLNELNIKQIDFANTLGVKQGTVSKWVLGTQVPDIDLIPTVCKVLGFSLNELFGLEDSNCDSLEAMKLYKDYLEHPTVRESVDILLERKRG